LINCEIKHKSNPLKEIDNDNTTFHLLFGQPYLINKIDTKEFKFYAQNFYPEVFEAYERLNKTLANLIESSKKNNQTDVVIEIDGANGVLASLSQSNCKKFYSIQQYKQSIPGVIENGMANNHKIDDNSYLKTFFRLNKSKTHLFNILKENDLNTRICVVFQSFEKSMINYDNKNSMHHK
jgi:hypothetical protein